MNTINKIAVAIISDNVFLAQSIYEISQRNEVECDFEFVFYCSSNSPILFAPLPFPVHVINLKEESQMLIGRFSIVLSAHCKQIFPPSLVESARCANIHPGFNPYNRGWFPQVFSILNKKPWGATFHLIDNELDHGSVIAQRKLDLYSWDTSLSAYQRVQKAEAELLNEYLVDFLHGRVQTKTVDEDGNLNLKKDYINLCKLDLKASGTLAEHLDLLRALSHGNYKNAYYIDREIGRKIYVRVSFDLEAD